MRISLSWLQEYVDVDLSAEALADALTMAGFEVEDIENRWTWADGVVVGKVLQRHPHPDADKLSICEVDIGADSPATIVCGASNVRADIFVAVAKVDTYLPIVDLKIKPRQLRGVPSAGMICSLAELGLAKDSEGIYVFAEDASLEVGQDVRPLLGLNDVILDLTSTANRADALSLVGVAREVAAITGKALKLPLTPDPQLDSGQTDLAIDLRDPRACPVYIGTVLENITIEPSPTWLQRRLEASGTRSINNIVDITNYVLLEWGQPLHAFDRDRLCAVAESQDLTLGVRFANPDEALKTLDAQTRSLQPQTLLITANDRPVALAGVMGGEATEVFDGTQSVILEAAYFDAAAIRRSARSQGLRTEASARYERGVNPAELRLACNRALQLMQALAGATISAQVAERTEVGKITPTRTVELRLERVRQILGPVGQPGGTLAQLSAAETEAILSKLGCEALATEAATDTGRVWQVKVPAYRYRDLEREIDLIEEIARLYGYDRFVDTLPSNAEAGYLSEEIALARRLREAFRAAGLTELMHYSVVKPTLTNQVVMANPLLPEYSALRSDLIAGLIDAFQFNLEQGNGALNGFELGHIFWQDEAGIHEAEKVGGIIGGDRRQGHWITSGQPQPTGWYEAKGVLAAVFQRLGLTVDYRADATDGRFHPGRMASLWVRGQTYLGLFGQLHPELRRERDLPDEVYVFQLDWPTIVGCLQKKIGAATEFQPYSTYPASDRDLAFFAPVELAVADLERVMTQAGGKLLESIALFDQYQGASVPDGQRSLAFRLVYRASDRTLTDDDIEPAHQKVRAALAKKFEVNLRS
ncbi:MAG: phenylalanine--tRNA ligase subunit beta [Leptolyngbyaceae cyanobacterium SM1_1_3]|nr:phenylalanine--tRNA ligase subunit beta [Leptolyngbyaceae cyanobacterium SM1_1_3]NJN01894.1 phenylalanine--tRNA ligase subunit beta [Leptolyngbyaceae cyanobacterium RM1_1_2]NJO09676.1 phenylalanine--tRNA ligase subunit beta [Leptolyngbyaceae cyanobacterium SL_1_1]